MGFGSSAGMASALMGIIVYGGGTIASLVMGSFTPASPVPMAALICLCGVCGAGRQSFLVRAGAGTARAKPLRQIANPDFGPIMQRALNVTRERFADWYQAVVRDADMAEIQPGARRHGDQALGLWRVGTDPAGAGPPHQGHRP